MKDDMNIEDAKQKIDQWCNQGFKREDVAALVSTLPINEESEEAFEYIDSKYERIPSPDKLNIFNIKNKYIEGGKDAPFGNSFKSRHLVDKPRTSDREYGELSKAFDQYLSENPEPHWKREVAEAIRTTYSDPSFIKLVQRRRKDGEIRILPGGDKIQWINKQWQRSVIQFDTTSSNSTGLLLPFNAEKYISIPEHSQIVVAGDIGSGKTHYGYLLAELNVGKIPIRHFFNEIGSSKAMRNLEDFPNLQNHHGQDYFLIDLDKDDLDVAENLDPNGLNIYDYLHITASERFYLNLQQELTRLSKKLEKGVVCVMLQKKRGNKQAMGGEKWCKMQCEVCFALNVQEDKDTHKECRIVVEKAKEYVGSINPETLCCDYKTTPKWGKLEKLGDWHKDT